MHNRNLKFHVRSASLVRVTQPHDPDCFGQVCSPLPFVLKHCFSQILPITPHDCCIMTDNRHLDSVPVRQRESAVRWRDHSLGPVASEAALWWPHSLAELPGDGQGQVESPSQALPGQLTFTGLAKGDPSGQCLFGVKPVDWRHHGPSRLGGHEKQHWAISYQLRVLFLFPYILFSSRQSQHIIMNLLDSHSEYLRTLHLIVFFLKI